MNLSRIFTGPTLEPEAILNSRSARAERQHAMLSGNAECLVSFTLNIPGAIKQFPLARSAFQEGLSILRGRFGTCILDEALTDGPTGCEALLTLSCKAKKAKTETVSIENTHPLGRLFDMDVLDADCRPVSRAEIGEDPRSCLICEKNAKLCSRSRAHSPEALALRVAQILNDYFRGRPARKCAACAVKALLYEVSATPKPGLVDRANQGSHKDMDFFTFIDSCSALSPWFQEFFCVGWDNAALSADKLFSRLRRVGLTAERDMFSATAGVNTHKGLIFSFSLLCCALGSALFREAAPAPLSNVLILCKAIGKNSLRDFDAEDTESNGLSCYHMFHVTGIRGEASSGFPSATQIGLPALLAHIQAGASLNDAAVAALLALMANVTDTNMIRRGGIDTASRKRSEARAVLNDAKNGGLLSHLQRLDQEYIQEGLSPGGCADLLAVSLLLYFWRENGLITF